MRLGFCAKHPLVPVAPGQKYKCASCLRDEGAIKETGKSCLHHPDRPVFEGGRLCKECFTIASASAARDLLAAQAKKRGRPADPAKVAEREKKAAEVAARKAAREAAKIVESEKKAARPLAFHSWEDWPEDEAMEHYLTLTTDEEKSEWALNRPCYECGVGRKHHGIAKEGKDSLVAVLSEENAIPCPVMVLLRGASIEEVAGKARFFLQDRGIMQMHEVLRIDYLPRASRTEKEMRRNPSMDRNLDPAPFALWMPLDNRSVRIDQCLGQWERERPAVETVGGKAKLTTEKVPGNPTGRNNPARWNNVENTTGAEILDLRNYQEVYNFHKERIAASLATMAGWIQALRNAVEIRQGQSFYHNGESDSSFWEVRETVCGLEPLNRPNKIRVYHNTDAFN